MKFFAALFFGLFLASATLNYLQMIHYNLMDAGYMQEEGLNDQAQAYIANGCKN